ncbi:MAG TPA: cation diffusion facilitator family transporter [Gemmatimonadales bacterium]|nr:cation diffusion facilitator family transporter [Gemmatimonadales bacterium]
MSIGEAARARQVRRVLGGILLANLAVVVVKISVGLSANSLAVFGDAVHSSVDAVNNLFGMIVVRFAAKAPDEDHPYGHGKFETLGALIVVVFLSVTLFELLQGAITRLWQGAAAPVLSPLVAGLLVATLLVNIGVVWYETRAGQRLRSEILLADAAHTRADVFITIAVIIGLALATLGLTWADPVLAIVVSVMVVRIGVQVVGRVIPSLVDQAAVDGAAIRRAATQIPGVRDAYDIRSRAAAAKRFAELTITVDGSESVATAHEIADVVEERLRTTLDLHEILVHVEPC